MKSFVLFCSVLFSVNAMASKARVASLQGADHIVDIQTVFTNPAHLNYFSKYLTFEMGTPGAGAEGGFAKKMDNGVLGVYLGHQNSTAFSTTADLRVGNGFLAQNNPVEVTYATGNMGYAVSLSTVDNKKAKTKESTVVLKMGSQGDQSGYYVHIHALSTAENVAGTTYKNATASPYAILGGNYTSGDYRYFGDISGGSGKLDKTAGGDVKTTDGNITLGFEDRSLKTTESDIYYGAMIRYGSRSIDGKKITTTVLPVFVGIEQTLNTWLIARASLQQNLLLGETKDETATSTDPNGIANNTTVAGGLGFKYNNWVVDGSLAAASSGNINGSSFLANAAATYSF